MRTHLFVVWSITLWLLFPAEGHARMHAGAMASTMTPGYAITLEAPQKSWGLAVDFPALSDAESARVVVEAADNTLKRLAQAGGWTPFQLQTPPSRRRCWRQKPCIGGGSTR